MPKWKKDAKEFEVGVNFVERRGYSSSIPKPIMDLLGNPDSIKFVISKSNKIELVAGKRSIDNIKKG
jgi:hypothetical protein